MKTYELSEDLINTILRYLATKPYQEAVLLIAGIHKEVEAVLVETKK